MADCKIGLKYKISLKYFVVSEDKWSENDTDIFKKMEKTILMGLYLSNCGQFEHQPK